MAILCHQFGEDAFSQAPVRDAELLWCPCLEHGLEDGATAKHQICPLTADARDSGALFKAHIHQIAGDARHLGGFHPEAVDLLAVIDLEPEMNPGNSGDGAGGAKEMDARAGNICIRGDVRDERLHLIFEMGDHRAVIHLGDVAAVEFLRHGDDADGDGDPIDNGVIALNEVIAIS